MIFSGFMVDLSSVFNWLSWIQWISPFRYASNMLTINEFRNITFCLSNMTNDCPMTGKDVLEQKKIDYKTDWDMWKNFLAIAIMTLAFFILAFIQLLRMKKTK
jgi:ATP-binding cassette subfamily G (WHITE) protein 2